ncbi:MAG: TolC family protein [Gammaproteobacteria bacterium]
MLILSGCTTTVDHDFEQRRAENMVTDVETLENSMPTIAFDRPLTLEDVIDLALINNLDLRVRELERLIADDKAIEAHRKMLPDLQAEYEYHYRNDFEVSDSYNIDNKTITQSNTASDWPDGTRGKLELTWDILDFGVSYYRAHQAAMTAEVFKTRRDRQGQLLALEITEAYWKAALAEDALDYVKRVFDQVQAQHRAIEDAMKANQLRPDSAKRVQKQLVDLELSLHNLQSEIASARFQLTRLMGLNQGSRFALARDPVRPLLASFPRPSQFDLPSLERYALFHRPELYEHDFNQEIAQDEVHATLLSMFPSLKFSFAHNFDNDRLLHHNYWGSAAASLSWNLLSIPAKYAKFEGDKRGVDLAKLERMKITQAVVTQVHLAALNYSIAAERFRLHENAFRLTDDLLNISIQQRDAGRGSAVQVTRDLLQNMESKLKRDQTVVELIVAHRRMLASIGMNPREWHKDIFIEGLAVRNDPLEAAAE